MKYFSTNKQAPLVSFQHALMQGLAPDGGLYFPSEMPRLSRGFFEGLGERSLVELGFEVARHFTGGEISERELLGLLQDALSFPIPIVEVERGIYALELFHGPTRSFKDVGARFMSRVMGHFNRGGDRALTVLVATSGDTGSAVANGFLGVEGVEVVLLYPRGQVSPIQEAQMTSLGQNVRALEVDGTFDDCQGMVKAAFVDAELAARFRLTSANSINIGRLIPQSIYYHHAIGQLMAAGALEEGQKPFFSVPSGNFGNLTAGLIAERMGLGVQHWVAATNANAVVPDYLESGDFLPRPSVRTVSNAMDVGNPSNFARMRELFGGVAEMRLRLAACSFSDVETMDALADVFERTGYLMDPHGAIGYLGLQRASGRPGIFLETAHPAKFSEAIEERLGHPVPLPADLEACLGQKSLSEGIGNDPTDLKSWLMG